MRARSTMAGIARKAAALLMTLLLAALPGPAGAREFRAADTHPESYPTVQAVIEMGRQVSARSGGRHTIRVFHSRQLGEEKETIEQTRVGAIDINRVSLAPFNGIVPETQAATLPFLFRSAAHLHAVLDGPIGDEILAAFEPHGFVGLAFYDSGARSMYNAKRPIRSPEDMKGLRMRVQQSDLNAAMMAALGATALPLPFGEVVTALSTGIIDGAENNWPSYVHNEHFRMARYYSLTRHSMIPEVLVMSKKAWDGLPAEDRALFRAAARDSALHMRRLWEEAERASEAAARAAGVEVVEIADAEPFRRAMLPVYDRFIGDPALKDLVRRIQAAE
ncbi:TRAP transporter substrate-binding protein [Azospirillum sp.]|uniref:TRAP transporter substrate-binding protein n=1 Tax=Azospirillum sp. TaxID=34012 RepID=UPI002D6952CF|nr:TRAP transporter substrate-binding protein [Azospirillum sp.]HYD69221.1 TRAP transporter substrate-binding protein [Azospirillum sp.]